ncbi:MAG: hypothetical protein ACRDPC_05350 [Solirubrobacteraceae bacterium]
MHLLVAATGVAPRLRVSRTPAASFAMGASPRRGLRGAAVTRLTLELSSVR